LKKPGVTLLESFQDLRLPVKAKNISAPAAKPNQSFNGNNCFIAMLHPILFSKLVSPFLLAEIRDWIETQSLLSATG